MSQRYTTPAALAAGALIAVLLTPGSAVAASARSVLLGRSNGTTATTTVSNSRGTPLALNAKTGSAPLKVNSTTKVTRLNADKLDGLDSASFARSTGRTGIVVSPQPLSPAICPSGTVLTGGGGLDEGGLMYSGPAVSPSGAFVRNSWLAFGPSIDTFSFAVCYSPSGKPIPGAVTGLKATALLQQQAARISSLKASRATR